MIANKLICFGLAQTIPVELCQALTGTTIAKIKAACYPTGYNPACPQCPLVEHGAVLAAYPPGSSALEVFSQSPYLLERIYRNAFSCYLIACSGCFHIYQVFLESYCNDEEPQQAICPNCQSNLAAAAGYEFADISF